MMKILVTGGNGQVAHDLVELLQANNIIYMAPSREELDITQSTVINDVISYFKPDAVVNVAAYTRVDLAEQEPMLSSAVNALGPQYLAVACSKYKIPLLHVSTDYVFDGEQTIPYAESHLPKPVNVYGMSKWQGELAVQMYCEQAMILRVSSVFGVHGNNFVKTILRLAKEREVLRIVADRPLCQVGIARWQM